MASQCELSRNQKKDAARKAVFEVLQKEPASEFMSSVSYDDVLDRIVALIQEHELTELPLDERDVCLALQYLHDEGRVTVTHGKEADYIHRVFINRDFQLN